MTLKGNAANERALIMRMHLLQSILNFHKNQRNSAFELLSTAELEWQQLQVNEGLVDTLVEMGNSQYSNENAIFIIFKPHQITVFVWISGYTITEARTGLRACTNNIDEAISFVLDRRQKLDKARKLGRAQRRAKKSLVKTQNSKWVNPRTLHVLSEMGFDKDLCALALQKTDNDINQSVRLHRFNFISIKWIITKANKTFLLRLHCCKRISLCYKMSCTKPSNQMRICANKSLIWVLTLSWSDKFWKTIRMTCRKLSIVFWRCNLMEHMETFSKKF